MYISMNVYIYMMTTMIVMSSTMFVGHLLQQSPTMDGSFEERDLYR